MGKQVMDALNVTGNGVRSGQSLRNAIATGKNHLKYPREGELEKCQKIWFSEQVRTKFRKGFPKIQEAKNLSS